jgi:hypothetical protein
VYEDSGRRFDGWRVWRAAWLRACMRALGVCHVLILMNAGGGGEPWSPTASCVGRRVWGGGVVNTLVGVGGRLVMSEGTF